MLEELVGAAPKAVGGLFSTATNIIGGNKFANAMKRANLNARGDLNQGYSQAQGYQQPIYNAALNQYTGLASDVNGGRFQTQAPGTFQFDPNSIYQDPEYQAQMRAGTNAINTSAQGKGTLFSGANDRDLTQFASDLFANRSDALYNRGFNAQNTNFNQNLAANNQNFGQNLALINPLMGSANQLTDLSVNRGSDLAANSLGAGVIRANNIMNTANALGGQGKQFGNMGSDLLGRRA
jgi:hypothetical protein